MLIISLTKKNTRYIIFQYIICFKNLMKPLYTIYSMYNYKYLSQANEEKNKNKSMMTKFFIWRQSSKNEI